MAVPKYRPPGGIRMPGLNFFVSLRANGYFQEKVCKPGMPVFLAAVSLCGVPTLLPACSSESVKHTTYETLQNIGQQQCEQELSAECEERKKYSDYKKAREEQKSRY